MREKGPAILALIGYLFVFQAFISIILLFPKITEQFNIYAVPLPFTIFSDTITRISMAIILFIIAYGYLKLEVWGYWLMVTYLVISIAFFYFQLIEKQPLSMNVIMMVLELIYTLPNKKYFGNLRSNNKRTDNENIHSQ